MRTFKKTRLSGWDIFQILYSRIPTRYLDFSINGGSVTLKVQNYTEVAEEKQKLFNDAVSSRPREAAIKYIFENIRPCRFIVFQSNNSSYFFQFGRRQNGFFLDYIVNKLETNKRNLERTVNYLNAKGFHETEVDTWKYKGYFFAKDKDLQYMDAYFKEDISLITDCIIYLTVEIYKEDFKNFRVLLG